MRRLLGSLRGGVPIFITIVVVVILLAVLLSFSSQFFYFFERVDEQEVGIQFESGRIKGVVGPGVYSDFGVFVNLVRISSQAIPFSVTDEEIITKDKQRIGLVVSGDIFRPNLAAGDILRSLWAQYRPVYLDDELARARVQDLARQSMKVCVGDRTFDDNIIGTARDALRACIDDELNKLASNYGLEVENVVVPEVILSPEVQVALDAIVQSRLETEKAAQDELRASAQSRAEQARQEGEIRVEQSRIQEQAKQQTILAQLEQEKIQAQKAVIEAERANELARVEAEKAIIGAEKANELLAAEQDLAINQALALAAAEKANADLAVRTALAKLYAENPGFLQLQIVQANADALQPTDKLIFTPEGTIPTLVLPGPGIVPTVGTTAPSPANVAPAPAPVESPPAGEAEGSN
jgi:regulator of protease activity HflC (stomatin/prohibitin superfamily)